MDVTNNGKEDNGKEEAIIDLYGNDGNEEEIKDE